MKKILMVLVAVFAMGSAVGQPALTKGLESKRLSVEDLLHGRYVGTLDNMDAWIFEGKKHVKQLVLTDVNLETVTVIPLPKSGNMEVLAAGVKNGRAGVMLTDGSDSRRTVVYSCAVDVQSQSLVGGGYDTLVTFDYGKKDNCLVWGASSPSGAYIALAMVVQMNEKQQYRTYVALFDGEMHRVWDREYALETMHDMLVSDEGRVVTLGMEPDGEETRFVFNILDLGRANTYGVTLKCDPVIEMHLAGLVGSTAVALGTYRPLEMRKAERYVNGVVGMAFDVDRAELKGFTMRPFQNEDMNIFLNKKTKKIQKDQFTDYARVLGVTATPYGGAIALGRVMEVEKTSASGAVSRESYAVGLHVVAVDTTGHVRWTRNMRRNDIDKEGGVLDRVAMTVVGDKVCLVRSEHKKSPTIYDIANDVKEYKVGDKCNVNLYTIGADGSTQKLMLEAKAKQHVVRALTRADGTLLYYSGRGNKTRMAELRFRY